ncbi:hypothetical protein EON81_15000 [bacterium]|nr:MAG: hypothetical protein EON81_15000 [bacterium]
MPSPPVQPTGRALQSKKPEQLGIPLPQTGPPMNPRFPLRTIHLDFHTSPAIPDVGRDFDAEVFAQTFKEAGIDSVTLFAKCHHGHLYYDTDRPERHPGLARNLNLLEEQVEALHRHGIRAPIYLSVQCDEYAGQEHPDWIAMDAEGRQCKRGGPFAAGWVTLDMSSPYQDFLADQIDEVLRKFAPVDGLFLDMCWDQPSTSKWAIDGMRKRGYDPQDVADRSRYAREVSHGYMARYRKMLDEAQAGQQPSWVWFNSRPKTNLVEEVQYLEHIEVESLPTGGWGYAYFPYVGRYVRPFGLPTLSHTARFHESWGDFGTLKPEAALKYECALILSQGMTSMIGDQLHPRGTLDPAAYAEIGRVYRHLEACEPYVVGGETLVDAAVLVDPALGDNPGEAGLGLIRALQALRIQFDLLPPTADFSKYDLVVIPETTPVNDALQARLARYWGGLLLSNQVVTGLEVMEASPYSDIYFRPDPEIEEGLTGLDHALHVPSVRLDAGFGWKPLARFVEPYLERTYDHFCSHRQFPPDRLSDWPAVVQNGRKVAFAFDLFTSLGKEGSLPVRRLLANTLERILPDPLVKAAGPSHLETSVIRKDGRTVVHLLSYCPIRRTPHLDLVEDPFPILDLPLSVRLEDPPKRAYLVPQGDELPVTYREGRAHVRVTFTDGHTMVVFE